MGTNIDSLLMVPPDNV